MRKPTPADPVTELVLPLTVLAVSVGMVHIGHPAWMPLVLLIALVGAGLTVAGYCWHCCNYERDEKLYRQFVRSERRRMQPPPLPRRDS